MSGQNDQGNLVLISIENSERDRCVDLFTRPDEAYGFGEFRRDPEDRGAWTPIMVPSSTYPTREAALSAAQQTIAWLREAV